MLKFQRETSCPLNRPVPSTFSVAMILQRAASQRRGELSGDLGAAVMAKETTYIQQRSDEREANITKLRCVMHNK
jgi:hypothetical protein